VAATIAYIYARVLPAGPTREYGARLSRVVSDLDVRRELVVR